MAELFDIANLITNVGVDAVKIKPEPGLPEKSSNEILTELFSTFDVPSDDDSDDDEADAKQEEEAKEQEQEQEQEQPDTQDKVKVKKEKDESKKKKAKKKHKHKNDAKDKDKDKDKNKDRERKHKHKKKSKHSSDTASDAENAGSKRKKKKKKSKRKRDSDGKTSDANEPSPKKKKVDESSKDNTEQDDTDKNEKSKTKPSEAIKIKEEKIDDPTEKPESPNLKEASPVLPPISKRLDDDSEALEVPKLLEKTKTPQVQKIMIKDLKNSEVYNNAVKEVENKKKEKAERMEDGEITDSDDDENRTPTLSPTPPLDQHSSMHSDREKRSSSTSKHMTKKNDLRLVLKEREKKKQEGDRSRSQSDRKNSRGRRRSKDTNDNRSRSRHSRDRKTRSRSGDKSRRGRGRSKERRYRRHSDSRSDKFNHNEDRNIGRRRGRSRSRERKERIEIDKKKLLEIARKNAINLIMKGKLPLAQQDKAIAAIQAGGKSIEELTEFCKNLSKSEAMGELSSISSGDESSSEKGFHHPFLLKERPSSIIMNIRDSKQLPTRTLQEKTAEGSTQLRIQYPVSSGQQHRKNEKEWIPVPPKKSTHKNKPEPKKLFIPAKEILHNIPMPLVVPPYAETMQQTAHSMVPVAAVQPLPPVEYPFQQQPVAAGVQSEPQQSIFPVPSTEPIDISAIVSQRLAAMRKLTENPNDVQALNQMYKAQSGMQNWVESKQIPGQFTGSTGAKVLTPAELNSGHQAWARKDQLLTAQPVSGGMGMALLQKMGWKPGEGLGKNKEGTLEPLKLEVKLDKRGLVSDQDIGAARLGKVPKYQTAPTVKTLEGKHPVSLLGEFCSKHKYGAPVYELCFECGPDHKKNFLFKVRVNEIEYKPAVASPNKKLAKAEAAQVCLQELGLLPANFSLNHNL